VPKTLRQEHTEHTRRALIDAATRLFAERGYADTSIDEVAGAARVTRGALYHHFASKQEIFGAVCDAVDAVVVDRVRAAAATTGPGEERLRRLVDAYFEASRDPTYRAIVLSEAYVALAREDGQRYTPAMARAIGDFVQDLAASGEIAVEDPDLLGRLLCATLHEVASAIGGTTQPAASPTTVEYAKKIICHMLFGDRPA
jgi:AcrR family transcriptional regulator